ncbi:hypothetical protein AAFF_G00395170 [Aldrovandia affinis]|uniref:Uncharacterized protein n=1 Tax=Aldrovandia affinis TaxID=143900 RepID=A0AAD7SE02_9TELE|nr:hypothetical protein AAFF_G00395170 [Aldrovandia affinis]
MLLRNLCDIFAVRAMQHVASTLQFVLLRNLCYMVSLHFCTLVGVNVLNKMSQNPEFTAGRWCPAQTG